MGQAVFEELVKRAELVESSPLYDTLLPVIEPILKTAQPRYSHPFKVNLVHEPSPNAFATPGGNVYVTDSMLYFVKNREQLAGTLCHEVARTIHHDSMELLAKRERLAGAGLGAAILLGPTRAHVLALALLGHLQSLGYSREVEARADLTGSDVCAAAGSNPWGSYGCFKNSRTSRRRRFHSFSPTIRTTKTGSTRWSGTSAAAPPSLGNSMRTRLRRRLSRSRARRRRCFSAESRVENGRVGEPA